MAVRDTHPGPGGGPPAVLLTLRRGLRLLESLAELGGEATARQLADRVGLKLGTCYHLLRTLEVDGYVVRLAGGRFGLGSRVAALQAGFRAALSPRPELLAILAELRERVKETCYIAGWYGDDIVLQRYLEGPQPVHVRVLEVGYRGNAHARASCKAILAYLPRHQVVAYFSVRPLVPLTPRTITHLDTLLEHLRETARRGYAVDREEFAEGVCCLGAAYFDRRGFPAGSYTVSLPAVRFERTAGELAEAVMVASREASRLLGYEGVYPPESPLLKEGTTDDGGSAPSEAERHRGKRHRGALAQAAG